jgi:flavorubredoxin
VPQETTIINLGGVNYYLVKTGDGYILIDTGFSTRRTTFEKKLNVNIIYPGHGKPFSMGRLLSKYR